MEEESAHFEVETPDERFVLVRDRGRYVAVFDRHEFNFELLCGSPAAAPAHYSLPRYYHTSSLRGARITSCWWLDSLFAPSSQHRQLVIDDQDRSRFKFRLDERYDTPDSGSGFHEYSLVLGGDGYAVECHAQLSLNRACRAEFANFMAFGVGESWLHRKQFTHTVWSHPEGRVLCLPHNPLHPILPGVAAKYGQRDIEGWIGFFAAGQPAWAVEIVDTSSALKSLTCDNAYDEHLEFRPIERDDTGFCNFDVRFRMRQWDMARADRILSQAEVIEPFPEGGERQRQWLVPGFTPGLWNADGMTATQEVKVGNAFTGVCWPTQDGAWRQAGVFADTLVSCSGSTSLRLQNVSGETKIVTPEGTSIHLDSSKKYALRALVKTVCPAGSRAYITADEVIYNPAQSERHHETAHLSGVQDWTPLSLEIEPLPDDPYVMLRLHLDGDGTAWFDCISLAEIERLALAGATHTSE